MNDQRYYISILQDNCGVSSYSDEGRAVKNFKIHIKNRDSFSVRKGNIIDWSDDKVLTIYFTKQRTPKTSLNENDGIITGLLKIAGDMYSESKISRQEKEDVKRKRIQWKYIEGVGS